MATNSGRGNPIAAADGPDKTGEGAPPPVAADVKGAVLREASASGSHAAGEDAAVATSRAERADPKVELPPTMAAEHGGKGAAGGVRGGDGRV